MSNLSGTGMTAGTLPGSDDATRAILDSMTEGVVSIGTDGRIVAFNPAASAILGIPADDALGMPFGAVMLEVPGSDAFVDAVLDVLQAADEEAERRNEVPFTRPDGSTATLSVETSALFDTAAGRRRRQGIVCLFTDVTELVALREAEREAAHRLEEQHRKLATAYRDLERSKEEAQASTRRARTWRLAVAGSVLALFAVAGGVAWQSGEFHPTATPMPMPDSMGGGMGGMSVTVQPRPARKTVELMGAIEPGSMVTVVAPFGGVLKEKHFEYGQRVAAGTVLGIVEPGELQTQHRDAQAAVIKAQERVKELTNWERGADVARARRSLQRAEQQYQSARQKAGETKQLLDLGVVARQDYQMQLDQERDARAQVDGARDEMDSVLAKGNPGQVRVAQFELDNARFKLGEIERKLQGATIRAPVDGIVIRPPQSGPSGGAGGSGGSGGATSQRDVDVGMKLNEGEALFAVGALDKLRVVASLLEIDINRVRPDMAANVTGEAFPGVTLPGRIAAIANQAVKGQGASPLPSFPVTVLVETVDPAAARAVRLGMTARVEVIVYDNPNALLLPPMLLTPGPQGYAVKRRNPATQAVETVPVTLGERLPEGVEIRSGLQSGDVVVP